MTTWGSLPMRQWIANESEAMTELSPVVAAAVGLRFTSHRLLEYPNLPPTHHI